jgi:hypothetical protein
MLALDIAAAALALSVPTQPDTVMVLGMVERDLTGDGQQEVLRVVGVGDSVDSLAVTFTIESSGRILFRTALEPLTRTVGYDAGRRRISAAEHLARLDEFDDWFFAESKFMRPDAFVARLRRSGERHVALIPDVIDRDRRHQAVVDSLIGAGHTLAEAERRVRFLLRPLVTPSDTASGARTWEAIQRTGVTVFEFSPGGDTVTAIVWSERDRRFYRLLECC